MGGLLPGKPSPPPPPPPPPPEPPVKDFDPESLLRRQRGAARAGSGRSLLSSDKLGSKGTVGTEQSKLGE